MMMCTKDWLTSFFCSLALFACDDPPRIDGELPALPSDAGASTQSGYAVVSSDFSTTALSLLDLEGKVLADDYLNSGSTRAGLSATLTGDVVLPKDSGESGVLVILDRFRTDVLTRIRLADGVVLGQVKTNIPPEQNTTSSYSSNPQDYIYLDAETAYVTRSEPNIDPSAPAIDRGNDLLRINPTTMQRTDERIDLSALNQKSASGGVTLYARPGRMVRLGRTVVVGIARSAFDFSAYGEGVIALVELDSKAVGSFALPGLKNCGEVMAVPDDAHAVVIGCGGDLHTGSKDEAGIALVSIDDSGPQLKHIWHAKDDAAAVPFISGVVSIGGTLVGAGANDYSGQGPDVYAVLDLATGAKTTIATVTPGNGVFGTPAFDAERGLLLLPDASMDKDMKPTVGVRRFMRNSDGSFSELETVVVAPSTSLPVRHIFPL